MKKLYSFIIAFLFVQFLFGQTYVPFPTETAQWNQLETYYEGGQWGTLNTYNYQYRMEGDTIINSVNYNKIYHLVNEMYPEYIGGMREDGNKNIYFFPKESYFEPVITFPSDTAEYLLYTFNNLQVGSNITINDRNIEIMYIDSVLLGDTYHKRYSVSADQMLGMSDWIEGMGSTDQLFACYTYEFEWEFYTLCFKPNMLDTYYISAPDEGDWCIYNVGTNDVEISRLKIYPNPVTDVLNVFGEVREKSEFFITDITGNTLLKGKINRDLQITTSSLAPGVYSLTVIFENKTNTIKFIKL